MRSSIGHGSTPAYGVPVPVDHAGAPSMTVLDHGDWREDAECVREDDAWWFAHPASRRHRQAIVICEACPVRRLCLAVSLVYAEEFGVWGGTSAHHRTQLVAQLRDGAPLLELLDAVLGDQVSDDPEHSRQASTSTRSGSSAA